MSEESLPACLVLPDPRPPCPALPCGQEPSGLGAEASL